MIKRIFFVSSIYIFILLSCLNYKENFKEELNIVIYKVYKNKILLENYLFHLSKVEEYRDIEEKKIDLEKLNELMNNIKSNIIGINKLYNSLVDLRNKEISEKDKKEIMKYLKKISKNINNLEKNNEKMFYDSLDFIIMDYK